MHDSLRNCWTRFDSSVGCLVVLFFKREANDLRPLVGFCARPGIHRPVGGPSLLALSQKERETTSGDSTRVNFGSRSRGPMVRHQPDMLATMVQFHPGSLVVREGCHALCAKSQIEPEHTYLATGHRPLATPLKPSAKTGLTPSF